MLTVLFTAHLVVFAVLYLRQRQGRYLLLSLTFALLVGSVWARHWAGDMPSIDAQRLIWTLRGMAWVLGVIGLVWALIARRRKLRGSSVRK